MGRRLKMGHLCFIGGRRARAVEFLADVAVEQPDEDTAQADDEVEPAAGQIATLSDARTSGHVFFHHAAKG